MTSVNVTTQKNTVTVQEGDATIVTVTTQGAQGATGAGVTAGDKGSLTVAANLTDWTLNDSVVTNAKVSASAGILGTKISPDFGSQNITTTGNAVFGGNLTVSGEVTVIDTTTLRVEDKNIELGKVGSPTDITADGGGITLLGDTNHTFNWLNATDSWTSSEHIALPDNKRLKLGADNDVEIYSNGSHGFIQGKNTQNGQLHLNANNILIKNAINSKSYIRAYNNGAVELYFDNVKRCETSADGFDLPDNSKIQLGDSQDIKLYHDATHSFIQKGDGTGNLYVDANGIILRGANAETLASFTENGSVELYHDNVKRIETTNEGISVSGDGQFYGFTSGRNLKWDASEDRLAADDNTKIVFGNSQDLAIFHNSTDSFIENITGNLHIRPKSGEEGIKLIPDAQVELYYNNSLRLATRSWGVEAPSQTFQAANLVAFGGYVHVNQDNKPVKVGAGSDLSLLHDGTDSKITNITGNLLIEAKANQTAIKVIPDGATEIYHSGVKKAETTANGLNVTSTNNPHLLVTSDQNLNEHAYQSTRNGITIKSSEARLDLIAGGSGTHAGSFLMRDSSHDGFGFVNDFTNKELQLKSFTSSGIAFSINSTGSNVSRLDNCIVIKKDGAVSLFHDGTKKAETTSQGFFLTDHLDLLDNKRIRLGNDFDFQIFYDGGTANKIDSGSNSLYLTTDALYVLNGAQDETCIRAFANGAVELYHDNVKKAETVSTGLDVDGNVIANNLIVANGISHEGQTNTNMAFDGSSIKFQSNGVERFSVTQYAVFMAQGFKLAFIASAGENPYIQSFGTNNGDLNIGSGSASMAQFKRNGAVELYHNGTKKAESSSTGLDVTGAVKASTGILFGSDTAAANTLDDYEEGTFTPTLEGSSGNPTVTYSTQLGHYTKIGNVVHIQLVIVTTSYTGGGGEWQCGGLPFTADSTAPASFNLGWNQNNKVNWGANVLSLAPYIAASTSRVRARKFMSDANTALDLSGFSNSETLVFGVHGSYIAA